MPPSLPESAPIAIDGSERRGRVLPGKRGASWLALTTALSVLGLVAGAVWMLSSGGVELGRRLAPPPEEAASAGDPSSADVPAERQDEGEPRGAEAPGQGELGEGRAPGTALIPDRAIVPGSQPAGPTGPGSPAPGDPDGDAPDEGSVAGPAYQGLWPYTTLGEVGRHMAGGDTRFRTPEDTALRFAGDIAGMSDAAIRSVNTNDSSAVVELATPRGITVIRLTNQRPSGVVDGLPPWSVVEASGDLAIDAPAEVSGPTIIVTVDAPGGVVGLHDRAGWRALTVATGGGTHTVRLDPGRAGTAVLLALAGDPRAPDSFTTRRVEVRVGAGASLLTAPADPDSAVQSLITSTAAGDLGQIWELLAPGLRTEVRDWRGLAARLDSLRDVLGRFGGARRSSTVATGLGPVAVVTPMTPAVADQDAEASALALLLGDGARLASMIPASVTWSDATLERPTVVASGPSRPVALLLEGQLWAAGPDGPSGLAAPVSDLAPGRYLVVALVVDGGRVTVAGHIVNHSGRAEGGPPMSPSSAGPFAAGSVSGGDQSDSPAPG